MKAKIEKPKENKSRAIAYSVTQSKSDNRQDFSFVDNRLEAEKQNKTKMKISESSSKRNKLGINNNKKSGGRIVSAMPIQRYKANQNPLGKMSDNDLMFLDKSQDNLYAHSDLVEIANNAFIQAAVYFDYGDKEVNGLSEVVLKEKPVVEGLESESTKNLKEDKKEYANSITEAYEDSEETAPKDWSEHADDIIETLEGIELKGESIEDNRKLVEEAIDEASEHVKLLLETVSFQGVIDESENIQIEIDAMRTYIYNEKHSSKMRLESDCGLVAGMLMNVKGALKKAEDNKDIEFLDKEHPDVGEAYYITGEKKEELGVDYHYGTAIMKDGTDIATLEAYAPTLKEIPKLVMDKTWKWDMYGQKKDNETFLSKHSHYFK